jgi:hypothetical protein
MDDSDAERDEKKADGGEEPVAERRLLAGQFVP